MRTCHSLSQNSRSRLFDGQSMGARTGVCRIGCGILPIRRSIDISRLSAVYGNNRLIDMALAQTRSYPICLYVCDSRSFLHEFSLFIRPDGRFRSTTLVDRDQYALCRFHCDSDLRHSGVRTTPRYLDAVLLGVFLRYGASAHPPVSLRCSQRRILVIGSLSIGFHQSFDCSIDCFNPMELVGARCGYRRDVPFTQNNGMKPSPSFIRAFFVRTGLAPVLIYVSASAYGDCHE